MILQGHGGVKLHVMDIDHRETESLHVTAL